MTNSWSIPQGVVHVNMIAIRFRTFWFFSAEQLLPTGTQYLLFWADWLVLQHISLFKFHWAQATELLNFLAVVDNVLPNILKKHIPWETQPRRLAVMPSIILAVDSFNRNSFLATCAYGKDMPCFPPFVWHSDHKQNGHTGYTFEHWPSDKYCNMNRDKLGITCVSHPVPHISMTLAYPHFLWNCLDFSTWKQCFFLLLLQCSMRSN